MQSMEALFDYIVKLEEEVERLGKLVASLEQERCATRLTSTWRNITITKEGWEYLNSLPKKEAKNGKK